MDEIKVIINDEEYTKNQFEKDLVRMFDSYRYDDSEHMGENGCKDVVCNNCPLDEKSCGAVKKFKSFDTIKIIYEWAKAHPVITNRDKLKEVFNVELIKGYELFLSYQRPSPTAFRDPFDFDEEWINKSIEEWLDEEWKDPK